MVQPTERIRWVNMPEPDPALLGEKPLFVDETRPGPRSWQNENFADVERVAKRTRKRGPLTVESTELISCSGPEAAQLDRSPPPELQ